MRILVANANTTEAITQACAQAARAAASPGTEIISGTPRFGPAVISTRVENIIAGHALLELLAGHIGQVEAVVLAVSHDTALLAARQLMPCPVLGMTEAACMAACMAGARFGLVTLGGVETYRELITAHGLAGRLAGLEGIAITPVEALADPDRASALTLAACQKLGAAGADCIVLGGAAFAGMAARLQPQCPLPLLDGIACGVRLAEAMVGLRLPKPASGSMAAAQGRASIGLDPALGDAIK